MDITFSDILSKYEPPIITCKAVCFDQKRKHHRPRINKKWQKRFGWRRWRVDVDLRKIKKFVKHSFVRNVIFTIRMQPQRNNHVFTYPQLMGTGKDEPAILDMNQPPTIKSSFLINEKVIELQIFEYDHRLTIREVEIVNLALFQELLFEKIKRVMEVFLIQETGVAPR